MSQVTKIILRVIYERLRTLVEEIVDRAASLKDLLRKKTSLLI